MSLRSSLLLRVAVRSGSEAGFFVGNAESGERWTRESSTSDWVLRAVDILLIDDHALFRAGLRLLLEVKRADARVHETASVGETVSWLTRHPAPDLCLLDLGLKVQSGTDLLRVLRMTTPRPTVVIVSAVEDEEVVLSCIQAGAMGYIPKSATPNVFSDALDCVLAGELFMPESHASIDLSGSVPLPSLTQRQREILTCLNRGLPNKVIANELGISVYTVKDHIAGILRILGVQNRTQAVLKAQSLILHDLAPARRARPT